MLLPAENDRRCNGQVLFVLLRCTRGEMNSGIKLAHQQPDQDVRQQRQPEHGDREFVDKSAASAASPDYVKFQAVIKSAASAASPKAKSREGSSRGAPRAVVRIRSVVRPTPSSHRAPSSGAPLELPSLDFAFGEAALAADLITA